MTLKACTVEVRTNKEQNCVCSASLLCMGQDSYRSIIFTQQEVSLFLRILSTEAPRPNRNSHLASNHTSSTCLILHGARRLRVKRNNWLSDVERIFRAFFLSKLALIYGICLIIFIKSSEETAWTAVIRFAYPGRPYSCLMNV